MPEIYFGDFRIVVLNHYKEIMAENPGYQSTEWFLLRYLKRIEKNACPPTTTEKLENSMRAFIRFYVDMIDEKSPLAERCIKIYDEYRKTIREKTGE